MQTLSMVITHQENEPYLLLDFAVADFSCLRGIQQDRINGQEFGHNSGKEEQHPAGAQGCIILVFAVC